GCGFPGSCGSSPSPPMKGQDNSFMRRCSFFSGADTAPDKLVAVKPDCESHHQDKDGCGDAADKSQEHARREAAPFAHVRIPARQNETPAITARTQPIPSRDRMVMRTADSISAPYSLRYAGPAEIWRFEWRFLK